MRTLLMVLMIAGLMSTVGVYAAGFPSTPTAKDVGSGQASVAAPNENAVTVKWGFTGANVTSALVSWDPVTSGDYDIRVTAGGTTGTLNIPVSGTAARVDDSVTLAATDPATITTADVMIDEN